MSTLGRAQATRLFGLLSFLTWFPIGLTIVPLVLLVLDRGFSLAEVSVMVAVGAVAVAVLELPTGGLADVLGRRRVLVAAALLHAVGLAVLGVAGTMTLLLVSAVLRGAARALTSGPLEAWYVDEVTGAAGSAEEGLLTRGLARGETAASVGLAVGTLAGGGLPLAADRAALPVEALVVPVLLAAVAELVRAAATLRLPDNAPMRGSVAGVARNVLGTLRTGVHAPAADTVLFRLLGVAAATGVALSVLELVTPGWLDTLSSAPAWSAVAYAVIAAAGFAADAAGASLAPWLHARLGGAALAAAGATVLAVVLGGVLLAADRLAGVAGVAVLATGYLGVFVGLGAAGPPLGELLHQRVRSAERATVLSVQSLVLQAAGALGALLAGALATRYGTSAGFAVGSVALALSVLVLLRLHRRTAAGSAAGSGAGSGAGGSVVREEPRTAAQAD